MTKTFDLDEAGKQLASLVDQAAAGEEIVIARNGEPIARLVPIRREPQERRKPSGLLGVTYIAEDFDDPLPRDLLRQFGYDP